MQKPSQLSRLINLLLITLPNLPLAMWQELRNARQARGWTIEEAAEAVGVDTSTYHRWELGIQKPHPANMRKLAQIYILVVCGSLLALEASKRTQPAHHQQAAYENKAGDQPSYPSKQ